MYGISAKPAITWAPLLLLIGRTAGLIAVVVIQQNRFDVSKLKAELLDILFDVLLTALETGTEENVTLGRGQEVGFPVRYSDKV